MTAGYYAFVTLLVLLSFLGAWASSIAQEALANNRVWKHFFGVTSYMWSVLGLVLILTMLGDAFGVK